MHCYQNILNKHVFGFLQNIILVPPVLPALTFDVNGSSFFLFSFFDSHLNVFPNLVVTSFESERMKRPVLGITDSQYHAACSVHLLQCLHPRHPILVLLELVSEQVGVVVVHKHIGLCDGCASSLSSVTPSPLLKAAIILHSLFSIHDCLLPSPTTSYWLNFPKSCRFSQPFPITGWKSLRENRRVNSNVQRSHDLIKLVSYHRRHFAQVQRAL